MDGTRCLGALKIYSTQPGAYDATTARVLEKLIFPAATLLGNIQASEAPQRISEALSTALHSRDTINRAQGFLMQQYGLTQNQALQNYSSAPRTAGSHSSASAPKSSAGRGTPPMTETDKNPPDPSAALEQKQSRLLSGAMTSAGITTGELWRRDNTQGASDSAALKTLLARWGLARGV
jgi:hypothetical protein